MQGDSQSIPSIGDESVSLVVTSPPYPMIEMWDELFATRNQRIRSALDDYAGIEAFSLMHQELDSVWSETARVLCPGGWACVNIGDATRKVGDRFQLYSNHSRIISKFMSLGFDILPLVLWRKQTNAPNKFMGSGMLPAGAYVTLEHEYILMMRKGSKRDFKSSEEKLLRQESAYFWEERNRWFSDIWDFKGTRQSLYDPELRNRSAAFPFELPYRLICMYSLRGDTVLDPFLGTGTTSFAAMAAGRSSIGVDVDPSFIAAVGKECTRFKKQANQYTLGRLADHNEFIEKYQIDGKKLGYANVPHGVLVMTAQEVNLRIELIENIKATGDCDFEVTYRPIGLDLEAEWAELESQLTFTM
jgi:DNA modification methylase